MRRKNATGSSTSRPSNAGSNTSSPNPETWGPQQNAVVNNRIDAARSVQTSASHQQHVKDVAAEILEVNDESDDTAK